jgi:hypothetical protein
VFIPHSLDRLDQLDRIQVEDIFGRGMVPEFLMVSGQAENVPDPQGIGPENIALHGDAVPVPADHLHVGLQPHANQKGAHRDGRHAHDGRLVVGHIDGIHVSLQ